MAWNAAVEYFPSTDYVRYRPRPWDITSKVEAYFQKPKPRISDSFYIEALSRTRKDFTLSQKSKPRHINDSIKFFQHPDRSPGLPYTTQGFKRKDEVDPLIIKQYVHHLKYGHYKKCTTPCNAVGKSMVGKEPKFRVIWVYPAHMTFAEGMFAQPLIHAYKQANGVYGSWIQFSRGHMRYLMSRKKSPKNKWLGWDWSSFDSTIPAWLIRDAFAILRDQLDFSSYEKWGKPTDPDTLPRLWDRIVHYFINTPVKFPDGRVKVKAHGVPSGSYFTQLIDSVVNDIVFHYLCLRTGVNYTENRWCLGDDYLAEISYNTKFSMSKISELASDVFGMIINTDKTEYGQFVSFLGYTMSPQHIPLAKHDKLMAQLLLPTNPDLSFNDFAGRARALQLSCFGIGCRKFTYQVQSFLDRYGIDADYRAFHLHPKDECLVKLEMLDLANWPPLSSIINRV